MPRILVTGSDGQLGSELQILSANFAEWEFAYTDRTSLDITDSESLQEILEAHRPDWLINCAAYTAVDKAEQEQELAEKINATSAGMMATLCAEYGTRLVHVSTDFVFDGKKLEPYVEEDAVNPLGVYGATKAAGEQLILENNPEAIILRTSWLYSSFGNNFVKTMRRLGAERDELNVIFDQVGTPTYAGDLAVLIYKIIEAKGIEGGIYHFSNEGVASWYDFAVAVMDLSGLACKVQPIETHQYPTPAERPKYSLLNKKKIKDAMNLEIPYWRESLARCINILEQHD